MPVTFSAEVGGRTLTIESGRLARIAGGSVTVRYGDTLEAGFYGLLNPVRRNQLVEYDPELSVPAQPAGRPRLQD